MCESRSTPLANGLTYVFPIINRFLVQLLYRDSDEINPTNAFLKLKSWGSDFLLNFHVNLMENHHKVKPHSMRDILYDKFDL